MSRKTDGASQKAPVLVHGATGFTGRLVAFALLRRGVRFGITGRDPAKLAELSQALGGVETNVVDVTAVESLRAAVAGRMVVCACAGPFVDVGEPMLATCARLGVHYVDTTGEQRFVADAVARYTATAEASGACLVPAMAFEIAPADWGAHLAAEGLSGPPEEIAIAYAAEGAGTSRGTKRTMVRMTALGGEQRVDGALVREEPGHVVRQFQLRGAVPGRARSGTGFSFPSPESVVVPSHTGARTVRTFLVTSAPLAQLVRLARGVAPGIARVGGPLLERFIDGSPAGPDEDTRSRAAFEIVCEAKGIGGDVSTVHVLGSDPYGLTAEIQAYAVERFLAGGVRARGVVAASLAFDPRAAFEALAPFGLRVEKGA